MRHVIHVCLVPSYDIVICVSWDWAGVNFLPWWPKLFPPMSCWARKLFPAFGKFEASLVRFLAPRRPSPTKPTSCRAESGRSKSPLLARAGKEEGVRKWTRLPSSFPNAGKSFLACKHTGKVLVKIEKYLPVQKHTLESGGKTNTWMGILGFWSSLEVISTEITILAKSYQCWDNQTPGSSPEQNPMS